MKKSNKWKRILALGLAAVMTLSVAGCNNQKNGENGEGGGKDGGKTVAADPSLAKQYVYRYKDIELDADGQDMSFLASRKGADQLELLSSYWDYSSSYTGQQVLTFYTMDLNGNFKASVNLNTNYESEDTETKETSSEEEFDYETYEYDYVNFNSACLSNDAIYAVRNHNHEYYEDDEYKYEQDYAICAWDKTSGDQLFTVPFDMSKYQNDDSWTYVSQIVSLSDGTVAIIMSGDNAGIISVSKDGAISDLKKLSGAQELLNGDPQYAPRDDGSLYVAFYNEDWTKQYVAIYNPATGSIGEKYEVPETVRYKGFYNFSAGISYDLVYSNDDGVYGFNLGENEQHKIMDYVNSDLAAYNINNIVQLTAESFVGNYYDNTNYKTTMAYFSYVKPEDIQDKKTMVFACMYIDSDVKANVIRFNKQSTEYRITIQDYSQYNTSEDGEAGLTKFNNDLIAGNIPDIVLINSSMPFESYVDKNLFADIDDLIKKDPELSGIEFMDNVFEAYRIKGKLYQVVPKYYLRTWIAKKSIVGNPTTWTMKEVNAAANSLVGEKAIFGLGMTRDGFMYQMMDYCGTDFVDVATGKCNFDNQNFISMLEYAKTLPLEEGEAGYDEDYWENYWRSYQSQYRENRALLQELYLSSMYGIKYSINGMMGEECAFVGFPTDGGTGSFITADRTYAISANTENLTGAWQFLRFFLTPEYQNDKEYKYGYSDGLSIIKEYVREQINESTKKPYWEDENGEKHEYDDTYYINDEEIIIQPLTQAQADEIFNFVCSVKNHNYSDENVKNIVDEEVAPFFAGKQSAENVANNIQNRVQLYINENR